MAKEFNMDYIFNYGFGIEIEMTGITRPDACKVAQALIGGIVQHVGGTYDEWCLVAPDGRKWKFVYDSSIQASSNDYKCELNSPVLTYNNDMETLQNLVRALKRAGAYTGAQYNCGIHIHVSAGEHTAQTVKNFCNLIWAQDELVRKALGVTSAREHWCQPLTSEFVNKLPACKSLEKLADAWYGTYAPYDNRYAHYNTSRYHLLNLHRYFSTLGRPENTIEIRAFNASLHAGVIRSYVAFVLAMNGQSLQSKRILADKNPVMLAGNEKFAMRTWLNRIGFTGDEFKNCREHLNKNLAGDAAWRFGKNGDLYR